MPTDQEVTPPLLMFGEAGEPESLFGSVDELLGYYCMPTDVGPRGVGKAMDARGRVLVLSAASDDDPIAVTVSADAHPQELEAILRDRLAQYNPVRLGLVDLDVGLEGLVRAAWRVEHPRKAFPRDIQRR